MNEWMKYDVQWKEFSRHTRPTHGDCWTASPHHHGAINQFQFICLHTHGFLGSFIHNLKLHSFKAITIWTLDQTRGNFIIHSKTIIPVPPSSRPPRVQVYLFHTCTLFICSPKNSPPTRSPCYEMPGDNTHLNWARNSNVRRTLN